MPLEQIGKPLLFGAYYTNAGNAATGLTVTVSIWELTLAGVYTKIVNVVAATEVGDGQYVYILAFGLVDENAVYSAVFFTADPCDQQDIGGANWSIGSQWVENVDVASSTLSTAAALAVAQADLDNPTQYWADLTGIPLAVWTYVTRTLTASLLAASDVWNYHTRTLTHGGPYMTSARLGDPITVWQYAVWSISITGLGNLAARTELFFTMKDRMSEDGADVHADFQVEETAGLLASSSVETWVAGDATLTVDDVAAGNITIAATAAATSMPPQSGRYDVKMITAAGALPPLREGLYVVNWIVTKTT